MTEFTTRKHPPMKAGFRNYSVSRRRDFCTSDKHFEDTCL